MLFDGNRIAVASVPEGASGGLFWQGYGVEAAGEIFRVVNHVV